MIYFLFLALATLLLKNHASKTQHPPESRPSWKRFWHLIAFCIFVCNMYTMNKAFLTYGINIMTSMLGVMLLCWLEVR